MSQRRMFSLKVVDTDAFLDMPLSTQALYFHLAMRADDDGFVANPKKISRSINAQDDDFKVLILKRFILPFESGVCVIKHWLIHNLIRGDRYSPTQWVKEMDSLKIDDETKKYRLNTEEDTKWQPNGNQMAPQVRLGKVRLGKDNREGFASLTYLSNIPEEDMDEFLDRFIATKKEIEGKAEGLKLYCESRGKKYKNYRSFLLNALKRDFKEKTTNKYKNL